QPCTALACELAPEPAIVPLRPSPSAPWDAPPQAARVRATALRAAAPATRRLKALFTFVVHFVRCGSRHPVDETVWLDLSDSTGATITDARHRKYPDQCVQVNNR